MNIPLIQHNLRQLEEQVKQGQREEAARAALALAKVILQSPSEGAPRALYGAYGGVAAALKSCYETLEQSAPYCQDIAAMKQRIEEVNASIRDCEARLAKVNTDNEELLKAEKILRWTEDSLKQALAVVEELLTIQNTSIPDLEAEIREKEKLLAQLQQESQRALEVKRQWEAVFDENNRLIQGLPDSIADKTADELIADAKKYAEQAEAFGSQGDQWLRDVIAAVEAARERMKQTP